MEIDRKELKRQAREAMSLTSPRFWAVTLVYLLMTTGLSYAVSYLLPLSGDPDTLFSAPAVFLSILMTLYTTVVRFGYNLWSLWTSRRLDPGLGSLLQGFEVAGRVIWMQILIFLRLLVWAFLLALPVTWIVLAAPPLISLVFPITYAAMWVLMLQYSLADYLLADHPDDGSSAAITRSMELMRGWKLELFKLELSFLGWELINGVLSSLVMAALLWQSGFFQTAAGLDYGGVVSLFQAVSNGALAVGLTNLVTVPLSLWLTPYRSVARAGFYEARLKLQRENAEQLPPL